MSCSEGPVATAHSTAEARGPPFQTGRIPSRFDDLHPESSAFRISLQRGDTMANRWRVVGGCAVLLGLAAQAQATGQIVSRSTVAVVADTQAGVAAEALARAQDAPPRICREAGVDVMRTVVVHVTDDAHILRGVLAEAERLAGSVYFAAGVRVVWSDSAVAAQPAGAFHVDVVLRSKDMKTQSEETEGEIFGRAMRPIKRAYVFYDRMYEHATLTGSNVARSLGVVIAHEVGHLLLPAFSHAQTGIMRARWEGPILHVPGFTVDQARTIQTRLADVSAR
jgi:hypothetical protein